jgi:hypothetical protein
MYFGEAMKKAKAVTALACVVSIKKAPTKPTLRKSHE